MREFRLNPFTPNDPVPPEFFVGRKLEIKQIADMLLYTHNGKASHILIQGERGIGKSSIALYAEGMATIASSFFEDLDINFFVVFIRLGACRNLDETCIVIINEIRKKCGNSIRIKIADLLGKIRGIQVGPFGIQIAGSSTERFLVPSFDNIFEQLLNEIKPYYTGILLILDETEQFSSMEGAGSFVKNLFEKLKGDWYNNVMFLITATPEGVARFTEDHESFPRAFRFVNLPRMSKNESFELIQNTLQKGKPQLKIEDNVLDGMFYYSEGYPNFLQEFGWACFEVDSDGIINLDDFTSAVFGIPDEFKGALDTLYDKYFCKILTRDLLSERYRNILKIFGEEEREILTLTDLRRKLPSMKTVLSGYLGVLVKRGILSKPPGTQGKYKISSRMLRLWLRLQLIRKKKITK